MRPTIQLFALSLGLALTTGAARANTSAPTQETKAQNPRKVARAQFVEHFASERALGALDANGKAQLFGNLKARFTGHAAQPFDKYAPDAALLMEAVSRSKGAGGVKRVEVELTSRYGSRLLLVRDVKQYTSAAGHQPMELTLWKHPPNAQPAQAETPDLAVFGITKPKHFKKLLGQAMAKIAPEDYQ